MKEDFFGFVFRFLPFIDFMQNARGLIGNHKLQRKPCQGRNSHWLTVGERDQLTEAMESIPEINGFIHYSGMKIIFSYKFIM